MQQRFFAPSGEKELRTFSGQEAAELLDVTFGYVRKLLAEGKITAPLGPGNRRVFSAEDIWSIRRMLASEARDPTRFQPGRRGPDDHLQVLVFSTFKGGSSKSTSCIHTAQRLALRGYRVLAIDADPQASLTTYFGKQPSLDFADGGTLYDTIRYPDGDEDRVPTKDVINKSYFPHLDYIAGGIDLAEFEHEAPRALANMQPPFHTRLSAAISEVEDQYDVVLIDCPPSLGFTTLAALTSATGLILPVIPDRVDVASLAQFLRMAGDFMGVLKRHGVDEKIDFMRFQLSRFDTSISAHLDVADYLRSRFGDHVLESEFLKSSEISSAGLEQKTVWEVVPGKAQWKTRARIVAAATAVTDEIHGLIQQAWGRT
jgi:chromosome partitioning protein